MVVELMAGAKVSRGLFGAEGRLIPVDRAV